MTDNVVELTGDIPSESLLKYLSTGPRSEAEVPSLAIRLEPEIVDLTEDIPSTLVTSIFGGPRVADPSLKHETTESLTIKQEPGTATPRGSILESATQSPLHCLDSILEDTHPSFLHLLPLEIRLIIYGYVLTAPSDVTLRIANESPLTQRLPMFDVTAIMRTNRAVYEEARTVFYATNRFHHDKDEAFFQWPTPFFVNLPFMKHVSLSYTDDYLASLAPNEKYVDRIDRALGSLITELPELAPNLRTFTLSILSIPDRFTPYQDALLANGATTATALRNLRTEVNRLSVITFGPPVALQKLRDTIAPEAEWSNSTLATWPQFDIPMMQQVAMAGRRCGPAEEHIRAWHLYNGESKLGRKPLEWEEELFGPGPGNPIVRNAEW